MAKVTVNLDPMLKILKKRKLEPNGLAQKFFTSEIHRHSDPYVPFQKGPLKSQTDVGTSKITYKMPYAKKNYYENKGFGTDGLKRGGRRGPQWTKRMWADKQKQISKSVAEFIGGTSK
ncbi:MAG: minor capsid protein [Culicoidibacterales bacterium]